MIEGFVDGLDRHLISGWAYDACSPDLILTVSVFLGDQLLFQTEACDWRGDLVEAGRGDGRHAFLHPFPQPLSERELSNIAVFTHGRRLSCNSKSVDAPSAAFIVGSIDSLDRYGIAGWAFNRAAPHHAVSVSIVCEGQRLAQVDADLFRPDLAAANIGDGRHAFRYAFEQELPDEKLAAVSAYAGPVSLPRGTQLSPFHHSLPLSSEAPEKQAAVFSVRLRLPFDINCDSVMGRLLRMSREPSALHGDAINAVLADLRDAILANAPAKLHLEKLQVDCGRSRKVVEVSRTNTQFEGADRGIREFRLGYEPEILALIDLFVPDKGVLLDIGSNWGYFSIALAARENFSGVIHAFEPSSQSFPDLIKIVAELDLAGRITCHKLALADTSGSAKLSVGLMSGLSSIVDSMAENWSVSYEDVPLARLDGLSIPQADLIKMDVEGAETKVLQGGERYICAAKPAILFENWTIPGRIDTTLEPLELLRSWNYRFFIPCWTDRERSVFATAPLGNSPDQFLAVFPFTIADRVALGGRVNIVAIADGSKHLSLLEAAVEQRPGR